MTGVIATIPKFQFLASNGAPLSGGSIDVYLAGTTTRASTWQDQSLSIANTNPVTLDTRGECVVFLDSTKTYKIVLKNAAGVSQWTQDNVTGAGVVSFALNVGLINTAVANAQDSAAASLAAQLDITTNWQSKLDAADADAASALVSKNAAGVSETNALASKVAAESARDAAIIGAGVYTTEALGRAAVADGVAFKVQGAGDVAAYEYRRTNSGVSVLIATYPSASAALNKFTTSATRSAFVPSIGYNSKVLIVADESRDGATTMNTFDGLSLRFESVVAPSPAYLYGVSDRGGFFDAAEPGTVFTDLLATTRVTASGDKVRSATLRFPNATKNYAGLSAVPLGTLTGFSAAGATSVTNAATAADGTTTADKIVENTSTGAHGYTLAVTSKEVGIAYRLTASLKQVERTKARIMISEAQYVDVNLATVAVITQSASVTNVSVTADTNGYVLAKFDFIASATSEVIGLYLLDASAAVSYTGDGASGVYVGYVMEEKLAAPFMVQSTDAKRPTYIIDGNKKALRFTAASSEFMLLPGINLIGATKSTFVVALNYSSTAAALVFEHGTGTSSGGVGAFLNNGASNVLGGGLGTPAATYLFNNSPALSGSAPRTKVLTLVFDPLAATSADKVRVRIDGFDVTETAIASSGVIDATAFSMRDMYVGSRAGTSLFAGMDLYGMMWIDRELTASELAIAENWAMTKAGLTVTAPVVGSTTLTPTVFTDSKPAVSRSGYLETSVGARTVFNTDATSLTVNSFNNYYGSYPQFTYLGVVVDGEYNQTIWPGASGAVASVVALPIGNKTVEIVNGMQSCPSSTPIGTWVTSITANASMTQEFPAPQRRILFYGDSITVGGNAVDPAIEGYVMRVRDATHRSVALEAWGSRSLHQDCVDATARTAFAAALAAYAPAAIWMAIGTNDYGLNKWPAADFGAAYADLLDKLHTALPGATIYCQTPLLRATETANGSGSTTGNYRTQIATAVSTRTAYAVLVDGTALMTNAVIPDGVHPNSVGHMLYANAVKAALGI